MIHESVSPYMDYDLIRNKYDLAIALVQSGHDFLYEFECELNSIDVLSMPSSAARLTAVNSRWDLSLM